MEKITLRSAAELRGVEIRVADGDIGSVRDFYFEDVDWAVLYLVIDAARWLAGKSVLISPIALGEVDWVRREFEAMVTREEIETSPEVDLHGPATREQHVEYFSHFGWPSLWEGELRSSGEVIGATIETAGIAVGKVEDVLIDEGWTIRYLSVKLERDESAGNPVLLSTRWFHHISWPDRSLKTDLTAASIQSAPRHDPAVPVRRDLETKIHEHFRQSPYWT